MRQYVVGLGFVALAGCSFVFVSGPPANHHQMAAFDCSESRAVPILDTIWTGLMTLNLIGALSLSDAEWADVYAPNDPPISRKTGIVSYGVAAALGAAGMVYGYMNTGECRRAKSEWKNRMWQGQGMQPGAPPPGPWPPPQPGTWPPPQPGTGPQPGATPPGTAQPAPGPTPARGTAPDPSGLPPPTKTP